MSVLYRLVICMESVCNPDRMCVGYVYLASVAWEGQFVNPQGGKIWESWHKKLVEIHAVFLVETHSSHNKTQLDFLIEIIYMNLVETLIIIQHLIYCMSMGI